MKDFIEIPKDEVLPRLIQGKVIYAVYFKILNRGNVVPNVSKLNSQKIETISSILLLDNIVLYQLNKKDTK